MAFIDLAPDDAPLGGEGVSDERSARRLDRAPAEEQHALLLRWSDALQVPNIAEELEETELSEIGVKVVEETKIDDRSRDSWMTMNKTAIDLAMQVVKARSGPWAGSSNVNFPLMAVAANQFAARAYPAIIADRNVVKGVVYGDDDGVPKRGPDAQPIIGQNGQPEWDIPPGALRERADRIAEHMSYQLIEEQPEWEPDTDKLCHILPIVGSAFRKTYFDPAEGRNVSILVHPKNFIVNYWAKSIYTAPRLTEVLELYPHEIEENKRAGLFIDQDYGPPEGITIDPDAPDVFYEQHRRLDLDLDGYSEPYIVTVHKSSSKVARIAARYDAEGILFNRAEGRITKIIPIDYYTAYEFLPNPEGGIYGVGFGQLLGPINDQINTTLNMLFDAGHLQNAGGGWIGNGLSLHAGTVKFKPGEYKYVNALGSTVRDAIVQMEFPGASDVLFKLLGLLIDAGKDVASIKDILTGDQMAANTPATTILALIEQGLKVFTAIFKRIHRSLKSEYDKCYRLNRLYLEESTRYRIGNVNRVISRADYVQGAGIEPVSDPKTVSDMQRLGRAEFLRQFLVDPYVKPIEVRRRVFEAAGIDKVNELLMTEQPPNPQLLIQAEELRQLGIRTRAKALSDMTVAVLNLAKVDAMEADKNFRWIDTQMDALKADMEAVTNAGSNAGAGQANAGPGNGRGSLSGLAAPPGNAMVSPIPIGLRGGSPAQPPGGMGAGGA